MTAKPESVESACEAVSKAGYPWLATAFLKAHRAEMAEALKEPSLEEYEMLRNHPTDPCNPGWDADFIAVMKARRRKHGVDK